ncbi:MAG: hypothetical protein ACE5Z5_14675 [Candidatus Bathyarchaeia archaeon]
MPRSPEMAMEAAPGLKRRLRRVLVHVPRDFLEEFDGETGGLYASRNEAIRAGMALVLESIRKRKGRV